MKTEEDQKQLEEPIINSIELQGIRNSRQQTEVRGEENDRNNREPTASYDKNGKLSHVSAERRTQEIILPETAMALKHFSEAEQ